MAAVIRDALRDLDGPHAQLGRAALVVSAAAFVVTGLLAGLSDYRWANTYRDFFSGPFALLHRRHNAGFYVNTCGI